MKKMIRRRRFWIIFTLGLLSAIGPFSIDMYLPAFPEIAEKLHTSVSRVGLSLSSFFIGISVGQLIYGPLLDRFGRKKPLMIGLTIYILSSVFCAFVQDVDTLIFARFVQALGSCAGMVAARALVRDLFPVSENAKVFSMLMLVIAVSPIIAPTFGGYITTIFGWHVIFVVLAIIATLTILATVYWLPAGRRPDTEMSLRPRPILSGFREVAGVPKFYTYALSGAFASSALYCYLAGSPFVFMKLYKVTEQQYGWIFAFIALGLVSCSQLNTLLLRRFTSEQITYTALACQVSLGIVLVAGTVFHLLGLYSTIAIIWLFLGTQGFAFPNTSALALSPFAANAGTASALMGAVQLGIGALATALVGVFSSVTALPMTGLMLACALSSFLILNLGRKRIREAEDESIAGFTEIPEGHFHLH
ncbi:MAG: multidrug effflux MFS transporter [Chitinophagaceae bacterium]|nr:multidrug effflux MFS transporter [Chitinophagaceae bacterium]